MKALALALWASGALLGCQTKSPAIGEPQGPPPPVGPEVTGWEETSIDGVVCRHPAVVAHCDYGWCQIPAGCFIMGSPETEPTHGDFTELLTAVTLTHSFEISQYETTQQQWLEVAQINPSGSETYLSECLEPNCPVGHVNWFEALEYANRLSARHDPPLAPCYNLTGCTGELGAGLVCSDVSLNAPTIYDCEGYRLPTEAEWEYAARAGTRTAYYSGDITVTQNAVPDPNLDSIAWYAANSDKQSHPVGQKAPNRWMLFDMLGNMQEWTSDHAVGADPPGPLTDPPSDFRTATASNWDKWRVMKGGRAINWPTALRAADFDYPPWDAIGGGEGFRLVRTLPNANEE